MVERKKTNMNQDKGDTQENIIIEDLFFNSNGMKCSGMLYRPRKVKNPPIVIMAHGFAGEMLFGLPPYAKMFSDEGMAVFLFDYRCFGKSEGKPRNLVSPSHHLKDWHSAIEYVCTLKDINSQRIALWGSSFSGGHVIVSAAKHQNVRAIVAQVPFVGGISCVASSALNLKIFVKALISSVRDVTRSITFRKPYYMPVVGKTGTLAIMNTPDALDGYMALVPKDYEFANECPARIFVTANFYMPKKYTKKVQCPAMIVMAQKDSLLNPKAIEKAVSMMSNATLKSMPVGHFDVYVGDVFKEVVKSECDFLKKHLMEN
ncbi:MAG: alpha/beta hydrolase [Thermodesulfobacteriota bacterium]|nr:alpha/beta hydrolase [Thermodesulfobacteriota bacterium]